MAEGDPAWTAASLGGRAPLTRRLRADEVVAIAEAAERSAGHPPEEVPGSAFADASIVRLMAQVRARIDGGHGAVILSGLDPDALGGEQGFARALVGLSTHLGALAPQSPRRDRLGYVRKETDRPDLRGYTSDAELVPHTDFHEIAALACVSRAAEGGLSGLASLAAIHDILAREAPETLGPLAEGYPHDTTGEGLLSAGPMPVLSVREGVVSGYAQGLWMFAAARTLGQRVPDALVMAMRRFAGVAVRPDVLLQFMLEPGEILFWHNFRVLHSRTAFRDEADRRRLLLRLWINPFTHLPLPPVYLSQRRRFDALHEEGRAAILYNHTGLKV